MKHTLKLQPKYYDYILNGTKRIEIRLLRYENLDELINDFDISLLADKSMSKKELMQELEKFYSKEMQKQYGVLGIKIELF